MKEVLYTYIRSVMKRGSLHHIAAVIKIDNPPSACASLCMVHKYGKETAAAM